MCSHIMFLYGHKLIIHSGDNIRIVYELQAHFIFCIDFLQP